MNVLILGDGTEERAWAHAIAGHSVHRLLAAYPGFPEFPGLAGRADLDEALATAGVDAAIIGGPPEFRAEGLRRAAAVGLVTVVLHPPGGDGIDSYYQVALTPQETGAVIVPFLPARLHPAMRTLRAMLDQAGDRAATSIRLDVTVPAGSGDLVDDVLPVAIDPLRVLVGEIAAVTASGDPPGPNPSARLLVPLRGEDGRAAELRIEAGAAAASRLTVSRADETRSWDFHPLLLGPSRLATRTGRGEERVEAFDDWDPRVATLDALADAEGRGRLPTLDDGIRTLEVASAVARSLRRGRTVELHYGEISEEGTFKSVMTSTGCLVLCGALFMLPLALAGPAIGLPRAIYLAYLIPPALVLFLLAQSLKLVVRRPEGGTAGAGERASAGGEAR